MNATGYLAALITANRKSHLRDAVTSQADSLLGNPKKHASSL
jgi:hypothetical protein